MFFNSIDATEEPQSDSILPKLGRLVNHGMPKERNARMKVLDGPALALYATKHISAGEQILYDYGVKVPWLTRFIFRFVGLCIGSRPSDHYFCSVCLSVCFFVQSFSQPSLIRFGSN